MLGPGALQAHSGAFSGGALFVDGAAVSRDFCENRPVPFSPFCDLLSSFLRSFVNAGFRSVRIREFTALFIYSY